MSTNKTRKVYTPAFKAKVALEALREDQTLNELGQTYGIHPVQISQWKKTLLENAGSIFEGKRGPAAKAAHEDSEHLYSEIGRLTMELDWLKKKSGLSPLR